VEEVSAIEAPDELSDQYDEYLAARGAFLDVLHQTQQAGEAGDEAEFQRLNAQLEERSDAIDVAGEKVGLKACAQVLPEDQVADVRAVIEDTATTGDPAHCTEDYTDNFVEASGGPEGCEAGEKDPANQADSVDISEVKGVDEVYARAVVTPSGGPADGQELIVELVFEDGRWKVDLVSRVG
jgi:hypothetical protein